jgi:hypothetical protein
MAAVDPLWPRAVPLPTVGEVIVREVSAMKGRSRPFYVQAVSQSSIENLG